MLPSNSPSRSIPTTCSSISRKNSSPATTAPTTATRTSRTPTIPRNFWGNVAEPVTSPAAALLALAPQAEPFNRRLQEKRLNPPQHIQKIVALSQIYGTDKMARAIQDAL